MMPLCIRFLSAALLLFTRLGRALRPVATDRAERTDMKFKEFATVEVESTFTKGDADAGIKISSQETGSGFCKDFWHDLGFADGFSNDVASLQAGLIQVEETVQSTINPRGLAAFGLPASNAALGLALNPSDLRVAEQSRAHELFASMPQFRDVISVDQKFEAARSKMAAVNQAKQRRNNAELEFEEAKVEAKRRFALSWVAAEQDKLATAEEDFTRSTCIPGRTSWDYDLPELVRAGSKSWGQKQLYHATAFKLKGPDGEPQETPDGPAYFADNPEFSALVGMAALRPASQSQKQKKWLAQRHRPGREFAHDSPRYDLHKYAVTDLVLLKFRSSLKLLSWLMDVIDSKALEGVATKTIKNTREYQELQPCVGEMLKRFGGDMSVLRNHRTAGMNGAFDVLLSQLFATTISELRTIDDDTLDQLVLRSGTGDSRPGQNEMFVNARELKEVEGYINTERPFDEYILLNPKDYLKRVSKEGVDVDVDA